MINPTHGLSAGPLLVAVIALLAASVSFGLQAGSSGGTDQPATTTASARSSGANRTERPVLDFERIEGPVVKLAAAGDVSGKDVGSSSALCPPRTRAVSGGFRTMTGGGETFHSDALTGRRVGWAVAAVNDVSTPGTVQAFAYCVRSPDAAPRGRALKRQRAAARREVRALVDRYKALRAAQL